MSITERLKAINDELIGQRTRDLAHFDAALTRTVTRLRANIIDLVTSDNPLTKRKATQAQALVDLSRSMQAQLNALGYEPLVDELVSKYNSAETAALESLEAMNIEPPRLSKLAVDALQTIRDVDYSYLVGIGNAATQEVAYGVMQNVLLGEKRSSMIERITATLDTRLESYASTYADTALVSYDRHASMTVWKSAGIERFMLRGPKDIKNRKWCADHVGKVFTLDEINELDNGTTLMPVLKYGGGWNCRHVWSPVVTVSPGR